MARVSHGSAILLDDTEIEAVHEPLVVNPNQVPCPDLTNFGYLFPDLLPAKLLPEGPTTAGYLLDLGAAMSDANPNGEDGDSIPSAYTYLGQFITHDLTLEAVTAKTTIDKNLVPLPAQQIKDTLKNTRSAKLDLDSVYGPIIDPNGCYLVPRKGDAMKVARAYPSNVDGTDLPRNNSDVKSSARIGDPRNDENLITSQLHLAFLKAHNALVVQGKSFKEAQRLLKHHYQWLVTHDFLDRVADHEIVEKVWDRTIDVYPGDKGLFMPLEFSVAAFRFGHSMIRSAYDLNVNFKQVAQEDLMMPQAMGGYFQILEDWIISWDRFISGPNVARRIDARVVDPFSKLRDKDHNKVPSLAALDLLRGYLLRLPTGQAVAEALSFPPELRMSPEDIEAAAASDKQRQILHDAHFSERTPLWFYILAEAAHFNNGQRLGPVGSALVAGVLIGLVRESDDSYLHEQNFTPTLGKDGGFDLPDLFRLASLLD